MSKSLSCGLIYEPRHKSAFDVLRQNNDTRGLLKLMLADPPDPSLACVGPAIMCASKGWAAGLRAAVGAGADYRSPDFRGMTCMHQAAVNGGPECVEFLLSLWPEAPFCRDSHGRTPFHMACRFRRDDTAVPLWRPGVHLIPDLSGHLPVDTAFSAGMGRTCLLIAECDPASVLSPTGADFLESVASTRVACRGMTRHAIARMSGHLETADIALAIAERAALSGSDGHDPAAVTAASVRANLRSGPVGERVPGEPFRSV